MGQSTWVTFDVTPNGGAALDFGSGSASVDTYSASTVDSKTRGSYRLYWRQGGSAAWVSVDGNNGGEQKGAEGASGGPVIHNGSLAARFRQPHNTPSQLGPGAYFSQSHGSCVKKSFNITMF